MQSVAETDEGELPQKLRHTVQEVGWAVTTDTTVA